MYDKPIAVCLCVCACTCVCVCMHTSLCISILFLCVFVGHESLERIMRGERDILKEGRKYDNEMHIIGKQKWRTKKQNKTKRKRWRTNPGREGVSYRGEGVI